MVLPRQITPEHSFAARGVVVIVAVFTLIAVMLTGMIYLDGRIFNGVRAYVRGEGIWAKAQKDAVLYLERYSYEGNEDDYNAFKQALEVNRGDHRARIAMEQSPPDLKTARRELLVGQNSPLDADTLIWFFENFHNVSYMREAITIWRTGDNKIEELASIGKDFRRIINTGTPDPKKLSALRDRLKELNTQLLVLENHFSSALGDGARWVKAVTWNATVILLLISILVGSIITRRIMRAIAKVERELRISESRFNSLKDSNTIGIASWGMDGSLIEANDAILNMLGFSYNDLKEGRLNWRKLTPIDLQPRDDLAIQELMKYGRCEPYEKSFLHKDEHRVPVYLGASTLEGDSKQGIAFVIDITERKKAEEELQLSGMVFKSSSEGIMVTDENNHIIAINPAFTDLTGYSFEDVKGKDPKLLKSDRHEPEFYQELWRALEENGTWQGEMWNKRKNGSLYVERLAINAIFDDKNKVHRWVSVFSDITEQKKAQELIKHQANYDLLTGLPNRRMIYDRLEQQIKKSQREGLTLALLFIDLDLFKEINDTFGHEAGDAVLKESARRMVNSVRASDTVGRLGGDEFTVILSEQHDADSIERVVCDILSKLTSPIMLDDVSVSISASIGIAFFPQDANDTATLFRNADQAMYAAKNSGRNTVHYFRPTNKVPYQDRIQ